jgi:hypothetical protein
MLLKLSLDPPVEVLKLGVAIRMLSSLQRLAVRLQAVTKVVKHPTHQLMTYPVARAPQFFGQLPQALAGPAQWRFRIAPRKRLHQQLKIPQ